MIWVKKLSACSPNQNAKIGGLSSDAWERTFRTNKRSSTLYGWC